MKTNQPSAYNSTNIYSSGTSQQPIKKVPTNLSLNLSKANQYLSSSNNQPPVTSGAVSLESQLNESQSFLDASVISSQQMVNGQQQTKFQFDIYIQKVDLVSPQPIYIGVQILKGTSSINTKKKIKIDQNSKSASFAEKLTIITQLTRSDESIGLTGYQAKLLQIRLLAFYNQKEKAVGICSIDLSQFVGNGSQKTQQKIMFQKCFDKNATLTLEVRAKEQYSTITESISEETDQSNLADQSEQVILEIDSQRTISAQEQPTDCESSVGVIERQSSNNSSLQDYQNSDFMKSIPFIKSFEEGASSTKQPAGPVSNHKAKQSSQGSASGMSSARLLSGSQSFLGMQKAGSSTTPESNPILTSRNIPNTQQLFNQTPTNLKTTPSIESQSSIEKSNKRYDERIKMLEYEVQSLKKENQEQKQKIVTLQIKEERMREYEIKCQESEAYRQKSILYESEYRKLEQQLQDTEADKLLIIESYERKLSDTKTQLADLNSQINAFKLQQQTQSLNTQLSTFPDDDEDSVSQSQPGSAQLSQEEIQEKMAIRLKKALEEKEQMRKRTETLEKQLLMSKEQICQLVNELYSLEKEQMGN